MSATLWRHPNGTWYARWRGPAGSERVSTGCRDEGDARRFLKQFNAEADNSIGATTVADVMSLYQKNRAGEVRSSATLGYCVGHISRLMGDIRPDQVGNPAVRRYASERRSEGVSDGTIIRELVTLRAALHRGEREGWCARPGAFQMPVVKPPPTDRWLTRDEAARLIAECKTPHLKLFVILALSTGARREAILELTWDRVDLDRRQIDYGVGHGNKRRARVYIADDIEKLLRLHQMHRTCDHVIEFNGAPISSVKTSLSKAAARAGLGRLGTHVFRHTAATWAKMRGESDDRIAAMLGASVKMVKDVYGHHDPEYLKTTVTQGLVTDVTEGG